MFEVISMCVGSSSDICGDNHVTECHYECDVVIRCVRGYHQLFYPAQLNLFQKCFI